MTLLVIGLALFLGMHSVRIVAEPWRSRMLARLGPGGWKGLYTVISLAGFALIAIGYGLARQAPVDLWLPPVWTRHLAALLTLPAFVLLAAAYVPGNAFKARLGHPMLLGTKVWALAHLLANGRLADLLLFGAFLLWAALAFRAARRRDRSSQPAASVSIRTSATVATLVCGVVGWAVFTFVLHLRLIGVAPLG
ncbi:MAG: hypothetical protein RIQ60_2181 [Pseudomonadota bacterium]|jgi:uncharacterized membrane protein